MQTVYENDQDRQLAHILSMLIWVTWGAYLFVILTNLYYKDWKAIAVPLAGCVLLIVPWVLLKRGHLRASSLIVVLGTLGTVTIISTVGQGIRDLAIAAFPIVFIFAGLTLDRRLFRLCVGLALVAVSWLALGETYGWFVTKPFDGEMSNWFLLFGAFIIFLIAALAVELLATNMRKGLELARQEIAQRKRAEEKLFQQKSLLGTIIESTSEAMYAKDRDGKYAIINKAGARMLGYNVTDVIGRTDFELLPVETANEFRKTDEYVFSSDQVYEREEIGNIDGQTAVFLAHKTPWRDNSGKIIGVIGISNDITERKLMEEQLRYESTHDILTGIYNRAFFETELARLEHSREFPTSIVVADVDMLKAANDTWGHAAGDELLRQTAHVLHSVFRESEVLARIGGDEFAVLLPTTDSSMAKQMLTRVKDKLAEHNTKHPDLPIQLSLGAATAEKNNLTAAFTLADQRMYADKAERKARAKTENHDTEHGIGSI
jgi:diguanylate cyclase (GGDEF)-like protein/PAS domain S-box-containing protein